MYCGAFSTKFGVVCGLTPGHPDDHAHYRGRGTITRWRNESMSDDSNPPPRCDYVGPLGGRCMKEINHSDNHLCRPFPDEMYDPVNHPAHYTYGPIEVIDIIEGFGLGFHLGNVVKYILRHDKKGGVEDLEKAAWYLNRYIEKAER